MALAFGATAFAQQSFDPSAYAALAGPSEPVPPGTRITTANWQQYQRFLSVGLQALFSGRYFWKIPAEAVLEVGPTIKIGLPKKYREDTEKYSQSVKLVPLPDGGYTISG